MEFVPLRTHSWYSFLTGPEPPAALCARARELGWPALALTDVGGIWGAPEFEAAADERGVRPILGAELPTDEGRLVVLVESDAGYTSLCRLLSAFHLDEGFDPVHTTVRHVEGLIVLAEAPRLLARLALRLPPDRLYVGLPAPGDAAGPGVDPGAGPRRAPEAALPREATLPRGRKLPDPAPPPASHRLRQAARQLGLALVALPDVYRVHPAAGRRQRLQMAVKRGSIVDRVGAPGGVELPDAATLRAWYGGDEAALARTVELAERCRARLPRGRAPIFPPYRSRAGESAEERLETLARAGLERLYGRDHAAAERRFVAEYGHICRSGFAPYFLVLEEIVRYAAERGIPCMGRGSAADSLVARCLGLTDPDPLRFGLVFERFLNPGRGDLPDVDLDFCWRRREQVIEHVYRQYGEGRVATLCTLVRLGVRGAAREAALACGVPPRLAGRCVERLPEEPAAGGAGGVTDAVVAAGGLERALGSAALARRVEAAAELLHGVPHHLGLHPGGTVVLPFPVRDLIPLQYSAEGLVATQYDKHYIEQTGAVKIDLLGNRGLTVADYACTVIRESGREPPDLDRIAEDDPATGRLVREGRTLGCFQIESPAMRQLLKGLQARRLVPVIQALALVRPGPAEGGMKERFMRRALGLEPVPRIHPRLDRTLADTYGVMLYQEDVLRVTEALTGVGMAAADRLRKQLGRSRGDPEERARLRRAFVLAAGAQGVPTPAAAEAWRQVERFVGYSFCKAHAVSYGRLAWKVAWLKAHEPAAFMAALLTGHAGMYAKTVYVDEARRLGLRILTPHVNRSGVRWSLEGPGGNALRSSLLEVRGLGADKAEAIVAERERGGPYAGLADLRERVAGLNREVVENLALAGALDGLGAGRAALVLQARLAGLAPKRSGGEWFGTDLAAEAPPALVDPDPLEQARLALQVLGFSPGVHPLRLRGTPRRPGTTGCGSALRARGRVRLEGWVIAARRVELERGRYVLFFTLEDETGFVEVVSQPGPGRIGRVAGGQVLFVEGRIREHMGAPAVVADRVRVVEHNPLEWEAESLPGEVPEGA